MKGRALVVGIRLRAGGHLPAYQSSGASGLDLCAASDLVLAPGAVAAVPTGIEIAVPAGYEAQVRPRSGLALKHGIGVLNSPGTIDADYRGEVKVILINTGRNPFPVRRGDRIAQLAVAPVVRIAWQVRRRLPRTRRGAGGFGHTGHRSRP